MADATTYYHFIRTIHIIIHTHQNTLVLATTMSKPSMHDYKVLNSSFPGGSIIQRVVKTGGVPAWYSHNNLIKWSLLKKTLRICKYCPLCPVTSPNACLVVILFPAADPRAICRRKNGIAKTTNYFLDFLLNNIRKESKLFKYIYKCS